jgi:hypothetical protein
MNQTSEDFSDMSLTGREPDDIDMLEHRNPFLLPSDEEVFRMRDEERSRKVQVLPTLSSIQ